MAVNIVTAVNSRANGLERRPRDWRPFLLALAIYALMAMALNHRVLAAVNSTTTGWVSADSHTFVWWLQWLPVAIERGENPLLTDYVHAPIGINAMWNIPVIVIAVLMLPVTLLVGPVAAYNVAMMLGPVVSGLLMAAALVPWTQRWTSRIVAGGLYAFSPYMLAHFMVGHLNLAWAILPPMLLIAARAMFVTMPRHPVRAGALLGVALTLQLGISLLGCRLDPPRRSPRSASPALIRHVRPHGADVLLTATVSRCHQASAQRGPRSGEREGLAHLGLVAQMHRHGEWPGRALLEKEEPFILVVPICRIP